MREGYSGKRTVRVHGCVGEIPGTQTVERGDRGDIVSLWTETKGEM